MRVSERVSGVFRLFEHGQLCPGADSGAVEGATDRHKPATND